MASLAQTPEWKLMHQGNRYFRSGKFDQAEKCYLAAKQKNPGDVRASFNLGDTYLAKSDADAARKQYQEVVQREQGKTVRAMAYHNLGFISQTAALSADEAQKQQLLREAIGYYKSALRLNPSDGNTRYNLALCQKQLRNSEDNSQDTSQQGQQQQQQEEQQKNSQQKQNESGQQEAAKSDSRQEEQQTQQLLNLARQAEQRARQKVNEAQPRRATLDKNW